jgi:preprotein translocase subunit SecD
MYQFPKWKYWLVGIVMLAALLFALPNIYGVDEALQIGRQDRLAMDAVAEQRLRDILQTKNVPIKDAYFEGDRLVLSFADDDAQLKARDAITLGTGKDYSVVLVDASAAPSWVRWLGLRPVGLGLDLRGGIHFMYEVDVDAAIAQTVDRLERDVRLLLRDKRIPYAAVASENGVLKITLRAADNLSTAVTEIGKIETGLVVTSEDSAAAPTISIALAPENIQERQKAALEQNITTLRSRVNELGVSEPLVQQQGRDRIVVELPGLKDPIEAKRILGSTATLEWHMVDEANDPYTAEQTKRIPIGSKLYKMREDGSPILLKRELIVAAEQMADARTSFQSGRPAVSITLDSQGGNAMLKNTQQNVGRRMGVLFIEKKHLAEGEQCDGVRTGEYCTQEDVISAATIQGVFGSKFEITGLSVGEARDLALLLRAGSLATPMYLIEQRVVGPTLGQDNIDNGIRAMLIGMGLTFAFMMFYYRWFGVVACVVLSANVVLLVAVLSFLSFMGAALSLPGIAGIVLTVGMAADANVLIYERIREELRMGNSPQASINAGFEKAFSAIADSNVTTLIAGIVLFAMGSGPIKGFAVTLVLGIATSLFTAILGSRALIQLIWGNRRRLVSLPV